MMKEDTIQLKMVEVDVTSIVPDGFWRPETVVVGTADGLLWVSSTETPEIEEHNHCLLNPLTWTCKVLPRLPFVLPPKWVTQWLPSTTEVAVIAYTWRAYRYRNAHKYSLCCKLATYDLTAAAGAGGAWRSGSWRRSLRTTPT